nr:immunoglobulin heavy chain junction region [Macaca mulatta]MOV39069.1 immunoglobulin heavy chain junction region [Macaca mulatta]MOV42416.1 immunoglobulin heavy chain junction region [Macaca mulatta]MOV44251.1 immunoglobulin heavy chain junction region [Macaca mulatta]
CARGGYSRGSYTPGFDYW